MVLPIRSAKLQKNKKFQFQIIMKRLEFKSNPLPRTDYRVYWKRGNKRHDTSEFTGKEKDYQMGDNYEFSATMFEKKGGFKKKLLYFVLQTQAKGKKKSKNLEKAEVNLAKHCSKEDQDESYDLDIVFKKSKIVLKLDLMSQVRDPNKPLTMVDDLTTMGLDTELDNEDFQELDELSESAPAAVKTKTIENKMIHIQKEIEAMQRQAAQKKKLKELNKKLKKDKKKAKKEAEAKKKAEEKARREEEAKKKAEMGEDEEVEDGEEMGGDGEEKDSQDTPQSKPKPTSTLFGDSDSEEDAPQQESPTKTPPLSDSESEEEEDDDNPLEFLAESLKNELLGLRTEFETTQEEMRRQLAEERQKSMNMKRNLETKLRSKEMTIQSLQIEMQKLQNQKKILENQQSTSEKSMSSINLRKAEIESQSKQLANQLEESQNQIQSFQMQLEEQQQKMKESEEEQQSVIENLKARIKQYEGNKVQAEKYDGQISFLKTELQQYHVKEKEYELKEEEFQREMEALKQKLKQYKIDKLSMELKQEEELADLQSQIYQKDQDAMVLQAKFDSKLKREKLLTKEIADMEKEIAESSQTFQQREEALKKHLNETRLKLKKVKAKAKKPVGIIMQGWMTKEGQKWKTWRKRWFILDGNGSMSYSKSPKSPPINVIKVRGRQGTIMQYKGKECLKLVLRSKQMYCQAQDEDEMYAWKVAFHRVGCEIKGGRDIPVEANSSDDEVE